MLGIKNHAKMEVFSISSKHSQIVSGSSPEVGLTCNKITKVWEFVEM
jgi:hypothetical protein